MQLPFRCETYDVGSAEMPQGEWVIFIPERGSSPHPKIKKIVEVEGSLATILVRTGRITSLAGTPGATVLLAPKKSCFSIVDDPILDPNLPFWS